MHSDLRASLVGKFGHDIDCENSEVRLICSLASQLGLESLIPTLINYRDNRQEWLRDIAASHGVSEADAKRLPTIILSGGRYETWLIAMEKSQQRGRIPSFVFELYAEIRALCDQLLCHPRFQWTSIERKNMKKEGKPEKAIDSVMMPRIVQACENEVLGIIHRSFEEQGWRVRAQIFDGISLRKCLEILIWKVLLRRPSFCACNEGGTYAWRRKHSLGCTQTPSRAPSKHAKH
jgi:hypothetical protein